MRLLSQNSLAHSTVATSKHPFRLRTYCLFFIAVGLFLSLLVPSVGPGFWGFVATALDLVATVFTGLANVARALGDM